MNHRLEKHHSRTQSEPPITVADLYPDLSMEEQQEAAYYLSRYVELVRRVFERTQNLTKDDELPSMRMPEV
jgi:hypothetical protein